MVFRYPLRRPGDARGPARSATSPTRPPLCTVEVFVDADFADLFAVKEGRVGSRARGRRDRHGPCAPMGDAERRAGRAVATGPPTIDLLVPPGRGGPRASSSGSPGIPRLSDDLATFDVIVPARGEWTTCIEVAPVIDGQRHRSPSTAAASRSSGPRRPSGWRSGAAGCPRSRPTIPGLKEVIARSAEDLGALRIFDPDYPERVVVAAGAPWFMTVFGRDSLLTAWMALLVDPDLARGRAPDPGPLPGEGGRSPPRRGARPDPPRDALRRCRLAVARRREHLLRHGRRHPALRDAPRRDAPLGCGPRDGRRAAAQRRARPSNGSSSSATPTATVTSSTGGPPTAGSPTRAGRTAGTGSATPTDGWPRPRSPSARCRPTPTAPTWPERPLRLRGRGRRPPTTGSAPRRRP